VSELVWDEYKERDSSNEPFEKNFMTTI